MLSSIKDIPGLPLMAGALGIGGLTNYLQTGKAKDRMDEYINADKGARAAAGTEYINKNELTRDKINSIMGNVLGQQSTNRNAYMDKLTRSLAEGGRGGGSYGGRLNEFDREARNTSARTLADLLSKEGTGADLNAYMAKYGAGTTYPSYPSAEEGLLSGVGSTIGNLPTWLMLSSLLGKK